MRYMLLIYSRENESVTPGEMAEVAAAHRALMEEAGRRGIFRAADPLQPASTATTVRVQGRDVLLTDGPFAETKEQLAGYYILDCEDLDEAIEWAAKIPTSCQGAPGYVEIRPIREMSGHSPANADVHAVNG
ncbi:MAG TPA: YciI family protein [Bryobacteraceae bacterium]|nr:YciI family protein [Bryobacteraceae bacterium]